MAAVTSYVSKTRNIVLVSIRSKIMFGLWVSGRIRARGL